MITRDIQHRVGDSPKAWKTTLEVYESPREFFERAFQAGARVGSDWGAGDSWYGSQTTESVRIGCNGADTSRVADSEKILRDIEAASIETQKQHWVPSPVGAYPIVPEVLIGLPNNMRRKVGGLFDTAPVRIYVDLVSSAAVSASVLVRRGTAIQALASKLSETRAVELYGLMPLGESKGAYSGSSKAFCRLIAVQLGTSPMNLALTSFALTSQGFVRGMGYSYAKRVDSWSGCWAYVSKGSTDPDYEKTIRQVLGLSERDMYIPPPFIGDWQSRDAVDFVKANLAQFQDMEALAEQEA